VVGVAPPSFDFPAGVDLWLPMRPGFEGLPKTTVSINVLGRIRQGVPIRTAETEVDSFVRGSQQSSPGPNRKVEAVPFRTYLVGDFSPALAVLFGAVLFVLLIACTNVANLLLAKATVRRKEMAIRAALGASRWRLMRQCLTGSLMISILGGGLGLLLALWAVEALRSLAPPAIQAHDMGIDARVVAFTGALSLISGVAFGLVPALRSSKASLNEALKEAGQQSGHGAGAQRLSRLLVSFEVAISLLLLAGAGLLIKSFIRLQQVDPGFQAANVLTMAVSLPDSKYPTTGGKQQFYRESFERIRGLPGVEYVGGTSSLPLGRPDASLLPFTTEGQSESTAAADSFDLTRFALYNLVSPDYFSAMGMPLVEGRPFTDLDGKASQPVIIIDRNIADANWPNESAVGKRIRLGTEDGFREIVGVVSYVKGFGLEAADATQQIYLPDGQGISPFTAIVVRSARPPKALAEAVRHEVQALDPELPLYDVKTMDERLTNSSSDRRFNTLLLGIFSGLAVMLAAVGLFGVMSYLVAQRTHEIGVRIAVGAQQRDIFSLVVRHGMVPVLFGVAAGLVGALALTKLISGMLFGVGPRDPITIAAVTVVLILVALAACLIPALRATSVDPLEALRYE
jgi:predicted permease